MARRKRQFLEDDLDSSEDSEGDSGDAENTGEFRTGFKRRRKGKNDAIYGTFAEESDDDAQSDCGLCRSVGDDEDREDLPV